MSSDILSVLKEDMSGFSKGQKRIAQYILESYDKAAFMTANKLAQNVGVSESTVVRFAVDLGFDGYPDMQKAMQEMVLNRLTSVQRIEVANDRMKDQDVISTVFHSDIEKLRQTEETVSREEFRNAVNAILKAKRVFILGVRSVAPLASFLGYYLNYMFNNVHVITGVSQGEMFEKIVSVGPEDVVIGVSFPRYSRRTVEAMRLARDRGATTIAITDSDASPLAPIATYLLKARSDMVSFVDSLVAPLSLANALLVAVSRRKSGELSQTFQTLEKIWDEYGVYEKPQDEET